MELGPNQLSFQNYFSGSPYSRADSKQSVSTQLIRIPQEQQSEALRNLQTSDKVHLELPEVNSIRMKVFEGNRYVIIMEDSELSSRMENILSRIPEEHGKFLIDLELIEDESFLKFAEKLCYKDLKNLARTGAALQTQGTDNDRYHALCGKTEIKKLIENLKELDAKTVSKVLEKTNQLSLPVPLREPPAVYSPNIIPPEEKGSSAANDLHFFVRTINNIDSENVSATVNAIFDKLSKFGDDQQSNLLLILESKPELGLRLMEQLSGFKKEVQDKALNYMSNLAQSISPYAQTVPETAPNDSMGPGEWHGAVLDFDANAESVKYEMMNQFVSLLENYEFSDNQLSKMTSDLSKLDNQNQRSYLDITTIGLYSLLGSDNAQPINLANNQEALDVIDQLRSSDIARTLISESRMGEKRIFANGRAYYAVKGKALGNLDQKQTIEMLVTDAWFNRQEPARDTSFATKLSTLEADQRDELVDELQLINKADKPLSNYEPNNKDEEFFERTDVIHESNDLSALLSAANKLENGQQDDFWQAANFLGNDVNKFIDVVNQSPNNEVELLAAYINNLSEQLDQEEMKEEDARRQASEAIDILTELRHSRVGPRA